MPRDWQGSGLGERGWYAPWWFRRSVQRGWPPFLRINTGGTLRPAGTRCWRPLQRFVPQPGPRGRGRGPAGQQAGRQVAGTLFALWEDGEKEPWLMLTDRSPEASDAAWYGRRAWIEPGGKSPKRAGWPWHRTRRRDPDRAARWWLAGAGATVWWRRVGGAADAQMPASTLLDVTALCPGRTRRATRRRLGGVLRQGWVTLLVALLRQELLPEGRF